MPRASEVETEGAISQALERARICFRPALVDRMAAAGSLAPLLLCNVPRATRDAALVLSTSHALLALSALPTGNFIAPARQELANFIEHCGLTMELVHRVASMHAILSPRSGELVVPNEEYAKWLASSHWKDGRLATFTEPLSASVGYVVRATSAPQAALQNLSIFCALLRPGHGGSAALSNGLAGILLAIWRQKEHRAAPREKVARVALAHVLGKPSPPEYADHLRDFRKAYDAWHSSCEEGRVFDAAFHHDQGILTSDLHMHSVRKVIVSDRCLRMRSITAALLAWVPIADYSLASTAAALAARVANWKEDQDDLRYYSLVLLATLHLGFVPAVLAHLWKLTTSFDGCGSASHLREQFSKARDVLAQAFEGHGDVDAVRRFVSAITELPGYEPLQHGQVITMEGLEMKHAAATLPLVLFDEAKAVQALERDAQSHPLGILEPHRANLLLAAQGDLRGDSHGALLALAVKYLRRDLEPEGSRGHEDDEDDEDEEDFLERLAEEPQSEASAALRAALGLTPEDMAELLSSHPARTGGRVMTALWRSARMPAGRRDVSHAHQHRRLKKAMDKDQLRTRAQTVSDLERLAEHLLRGRGAGKAKEDFEGALPPLGREETVLLLDPKEPDPEVDKALRFVQHYQKILRGQGGGGAGEKRTTTPAEDPEPPSTPLPPPPPMRGDQADHQPMRKGWWHRAEIFFRKRREAGSGA